MSHSCIIETTHIEDSNLIDAASIDQAILDFVRLHEIERGERIRRQEDCALSLEMENLCSGPAFGCTIADLIEELQTQFPEITVGDSRRVQKKFLRRSGHNYPDAEISAAVHNTPVHCPPGGDVTRRLEALLDSERLRLEIDYLPELPGANETTTVCVIRISEPAVPASAVNLAHSAESTTCQTTGKRRRGRWPKERTEPEVARYLNERSKKYKDLITGCLNGERESIRDFNATFGPTAIADKLGDGCARQNVMKTDTYSKLIQPVIQGDAPAGWESTEHDYSDYSDIFNNMHAEARAAE